MTVCLYGTKGEMLNKKYKNEDEKNTNNSKSVASLVGGICRDTAGTVFWRNLYRGESD